MLESLPSKRLKLGRYRQGGMVGMVGMSKDTASCYTTRDGGVSPAGDGGRSPGQIRRYERAVTGRNAKAEEGRGEKGCAVDGCIVYSRGRGLRTCAWW